jgi:hypothetical protein
MADDQLSLAFDSAPLLQPGAVPHLRDEIARVWSLPLGERVEIVFRPAFTLAAVTGFLELRDAPAMPWDCHQPLLLRVAGCDFSPRDIASWKRL